MHCFSDGQATLVRSPLGSIVAGDDAIRVPEPGSNVTSCPPPAIAVQYVLAGGHATLTSEPPLSIVTGVVMGLTGETGSNVPSCPSPTAMHWLADGHATPGR